MKKFVLVLGPSRHTRGGITSVIKAYQQSDLWERYNCIWIETYEDKNNCVKILYFLYGLFKFIYYLPNAKLIHIHNSLSISTIRKSIFFLLAKITNKRTIIHLHCSSEPVIKSSVKSIYKYLFRKADAAIFLTDSIKSEIEEHFNVRHSIRIYNPCRITSANEIINTTAKKKYILFAGTISKRKGAKDLIHAFGCIARKYPSWKVIFAGNGEIKEGQAVSKELKIENQIDFVGWLHGEKMEQLFQSASIFCLPSYAEGFPMAILDAWSYGIPVISTPVGGLSEILRHRENSLVFEPGDISTLAKYVEELILNTNLRIKLIRTSYELCYNTFSLENITNQLSNLYESLLY